MATNRRVILAIGVVVSFALLILFLSMYIDAQHDARMENKLTPEQVALMSDEELRVHLETREPMKPLTYTYYLIPFAGFIGLLIGTLVYYLMADKLASKQKSLAKNTKILLRFLSADQRKVVEFLLERGGYAPQYELSHLPRLNKVKTHRILEQLHQKGIIKKERFGKINRISLAADLKDFLS